MKMHSRFCVWFLALLVVSAATPGQTPDLQPLEDLRKSATDFLAKRLAGDGNSTLHIAASTLDPRLRLQHCTGALQGILPPITQISARITIGLRCPFPAWTVYVPMTVETELNVLVMRQAAARNTTPAASDVELQIRRVPGIATGYLTRTEQLSGHHLKTPVSPGTALSIDLLAPDILVKRGQRVMLIASAGGIEVRAQGEAMADATAAGRVRVLNLSSRKVVEGQVESSDRVRVSL